MAASPGSNRTKIIGVIPSSAAVIYHHKTGFFLRACVLTAVIRQVNGVLYRLGYWTDSWTKVCHELHSVYLSVQQEMGSFSL